jgi:hypothetical protein
MQDFAISILAFPSQKLFGHKIKMSILTAKKADYSYYINVKNKRRNTETNPGRN